jgi:hypothetical protein
MAEGIDWLQSFGICQVSECIDSAFLFLYCMILDHYFPNKPANKILDFK